MVPAKSVSSISWKRLSLPFLRAAANGAYSGSARKLLTGWFDGNWINAMRLVSRGLPSSVLTFPLRERYLPPCLCTNSCTDAAYAGILSLSQIKSVCIDGAVRQAQVDLRDARRTE